MWKTLYFIIGPSHTLLTPHITVLKNYMNNLIILLQLLDKNSELHYT